MPPITAKLGHCDHCLSTQDEEILEGMIEQMIQTTAKAMAAIDRAVDFVEASNNRINTMETLRSLPQTIPH